MKDSKVEDEGLTLISRSLSETQQLGTLLGQLLKGGEVICLEGELGTGKTSLIQGIGRGQGIEGPITSPTFTLVNEYRGRRAILYHVDLYRLDSIEEMIATGIDGCFYADGICMVEWAEKAKEILPPERLYVTLQHINEEQRRILLQAKGAYYNQLLHRLKKRLESHR